MRLTQPATLRPHRTTAKPRKQGRKLYHILLPNTRL